MKTVHHICQDTILKYSCLNRKLKGRTWIETKHFDIVKLSPAVGAKMDTSLGL